MNPFYIYALKDPRCSPARPFYIGKGTGNRAWEHTLRIDKTRKGKLISAIVAAGYEVVTAVLADDLTEVQAIKLEAELISAFGVIEQGGLLANHVVPSGLATAKAGVTVPAGVVEKAQIGLDLLKGAVLELSQANAQGVTNSDVAKSLGLQSDYAGGSKDYLSWSVLGLLMKEGRVSRGEQKRHFARVK